MKPLLLIKDDTQTAHPALNGGYATRPLRWEALRDEVTHEFNGLRIRWVPSPALPGWKIAREPEG